MIKLRILAGAYLLCGEEMLLMCRSETRKFYPGVWGALGGHLEPEEMNDPRAACLRELFEESGIGEGDLEDLVLRYIIYEKNGDELVILYAYVGQAITKHLGKETTEGTLHWVSREMLLDRKLSFATQSTLEHYLSTPLRKGELFVGTISHETLEPTITWARLE